MVEYVISYQYLKGKDLLMLDIKVWATSAQSAAEIALLAIQSQGYEAFFVTDITPYVASKQK